MHALLESGFSLSILCINISDKCYFYMSFIGDIQGTVLASVG